MHRLQFGVVLGLVALLAIGCQSTERRETVTAEGTGVNLEALEKDVTTYQQEVTLLRDQIQGLESRLAKQESAKSTWTAPTQGGGDVGVAIAGPKEAYPGQVIPYRVTVNNTTGANAVDVQVRAKIDPNLTVSELGGGQWAGSGADRMIVWRVGNVAPSKTHTITFTATAKRTGIVNNCVDISHRIASCSSTEILQPAVACTVTTNKVQRVGQAFPVKLTVTNTGSGVAQAVRGQVILSKGLTLSGSGSAITFGDIASGRRMEKQIMVVGNAAGPFEVQLKVNANPNLQTTCATAGELVIPQIGITKTGPKVRYQGQPINYKIEVTNTGSATAENVIVRDALPQGTQFVSAGQSGRLVGNAVEWQLGNLAPDQSRSLSLTLNSTREGEITNCAEVTATGLPKKQACAKTRVLFVAAMHIDCIDTEDPVEVGGETTYVISIKNEGKKDTTNVVLTVDLPEESEYISSESALVGSGATSQRKVTFRPIPRMTPNQEVIYKVRVRFIKEGSAVCSAQMTFDEFSKPVRSEEGTNAYR